MQFCFQTIFYQNEPNLVVNPTITHIKFILCGDAISISDLTKNPIWGKVIILFRVLFWTSVTCKTSPAWVPTSELSQLRRVALSLCGP